MKEFIKTGLLSFGMSGRVFHAPFLNASPRFKFYAVVERSKKRAAALYPDIISYDDPGQLLNDKEVELIVVNTPNNTHYDYCKAALEAGKHVLVEKPFCTTSAEARELFALAKGKSLKLMVYQNRRWDADFKQLSAIISEGVLGQLVEVHLRFDRFKAALSEKSFKEDPIDASGLIYDLGPHIIDQVIALFGKPLSFTKISASFRPGSMVDDYFHITMKYENNLHVFVTGGLLNSAELPSYAANGTLGSFTKMRSDMQEQQLQNGMSPLDEEYGIEDPSGRGVLIRYDEAGNRSREVLDISRGNYAALFDAVSANILNDKPFPVTEEQIIWQLEIIESLSNN